MDAGSWFHPSYSTARMPSLKDVLDFSKNKNLTLFIELKDPNLQIAQKTSKLLEEYEMIDRAYVISFEHHLLSWLYKNYPQICLGISFSTISNELISKSLEIEAKGLILPYYKVDTPLVENIQKHDLKVWLYGGHPEREEDRITKVKQSLTCRVDGYFTDSLNLN